MDHEIFRRIGGAFFFSGFRWGSEGQHGPPGDVSMVSRDAAIACTAVNPAAIGPLEIVISDPPGQ